ncbi:hypothetical protein GGF31_001446 [Allomyces arbusculus]|nr:hypothetical protein GGF31_001446 [Allomyces arbusculus]
MAQPPSTSSSTPPPQRPAWHGTALRALAAIPCSDTRSGLGAITMRPTATGPTSTPRTTARRRRTRAAAGLPAHYWQRTPAVDDALAVAAMERRLFARLKRTERSATLAVFAMPGAGPPGAVRRRVPAPPTPRPLFQAQRQDHDDGDDEDAEEDDVGDSESASAASDVAATRDGSFLTAAHGLDDDDGDDEFHDARSRHTTVDQTLVGAPPGSNNDPDLGGPTAVLPTGRTRILRTNRGARLTLEPDDELAFLGRRVGMQVDGPEAADEEVEEEAGVGGPPTEFHAADNPFM